MPEWYYEKPEETAIDSFFIRAFEDLSTCRPFSSNGIGPIPWPNIIGYALYNNLNEINMEYFTSVIRNMDGLYLDDLEKKREAEIKRLNASGKKG